MAKDLDILLKQMEKNDKNYNVFDPLISEYNGLLLNNKKKKWKHLRLKKSKDTYQD